MGKRQRWFGERDRLKPIEIENLVGSRCEIRPEEEPPSEDKIFIENLKDLQMIMQNKIRRTEYLEKLQIFQNGLDQIRRPVFIGKAATEEESEQNQNKMSSLYSAAPSS